MNIKLSSQSSLRVSRRFFLLTASSFAASLAVSACSRDSGSQASGNDNVIKVGTSWIVTEDILKFVRDNLASKAGLTVEIVMMNDWVLPNTSLKDGSIDANLFQHKVFMGKAAKELNLDLVVLDPLFLYKQGIFSKRYTSLDQIPQNATVTIANDEINQGQALRVLENNGLLKIKPEVGEFPTTKDILENPKNLQITEVEGAQVVRAVDDVDFIVSETQSVALSGIKPSPLGKETIVADKYAIVLSTWQGKENEPKIQKLNELLKSPEVKSFINQHFEGRIVPVT